MRSLTTSSLAFVAICACAVAQDFLNTPPEGFFTPSSFASTAGQAAAVAAGRHPNVTSSVTFKGVVGNTQQTFTWRVNITDLTVPNNINKFGDPSASHSKGLHAANTQWQLEWPQGDTGRSLQSFVSDSKQRAMFISAGINFAPSSITNSWTNPSDGNCSSILTATCVAELQQLSLKINSNQTNSISQECTNIINTAMGSGFLAAAPFEPNEYTTPFYSNETIFYTTSAPYTTTNESLYEYAKSTLQMLQIYFQDESGQYSESTVVCQILCKDCPHAPSPSAGALSARATVILAFFVAIAVMLVTF